MIHVSSPSLVAGLTAAALLGARHGMDCDHIAALGDFVSIEKRVGHYIRLELIYIAGHSLVIATLGSAAIAMQFALPPAIDRWMGRMVSFTLVAFSVWIGYSLVRSRGHGEFHGHPGPSFDVGIPLVRGTLRFCARYRHRL
jgi:high-affinity nickel permease